VNKMDEQKTQTLMYAALLVNAGGYEITEARLLSVINSAGIVFDKIEINKVVTALQGIDIQEVIKNPFVAVESAAILPEEEDEEEVIEPEIVTGFDILFGKGE